MSVKTLSKISAGLMLSLGGNYMEVSDKDGGGVGEEGRGGIQCGRL